MHIEGEPLVSIDFELIPEEMAEAWVAHLYDTPFHRDVRRTWRVCFGSFFGTVALTAWLTAWTGASLLIGIALLAAGGGLIATTPSMYKRSLLTAFTKQTKGGVTHGLFGPHRLELRPEGMLDITPAYETLWRWSSVDGVSEIDGAFLVRLGALEFLLIPKSAFRDSDAMRRFGDVFFERLARPRLSQEYDGGGESVAGGSAPEKLPAVEVGEPQSHGDAKVGS